MKQIKISSIHFIFLIIYVSLCSNIAHSAPVVPTGLCINNSKCGSATQAGLFPGTNLKFYPGIIIWSHENQSPSSIEANWQALFSAEKNRKETYRPPGVYGGVTAKLNWSRYYKDQTVRPEDPTDHTDSAYDWTSIDNIFNINAVKNEGALVVIKVSDIGNGRPPKWLLNEPYNGGFLAQVYGDNPPTTLTPKYYRYATPDNRGYTNAGNSLPIVEEYIYFHQALHDHLIATGHINKVMLVHLGEVFISNPNLPADYNSTGFQHGTGVRNQQIAKIWAGSQIFVQASSLVGPYTQTLWEYMDSSTLGITFPDMKMNGTKHFSGAQRFTHPDGTDQKDLRPLSQAIEANGFRANTYFSPGIPNPWGYSGVSVPQTMSHVLWALSGSPKGENKDSGLGQEGTDPSGVMPVHNVLVSWSMTWDDLNPSLDEWHEAIDTFGPPGTFAFPYLPPEYQP